MKIKLYGILGYPLGHTLSPAMHNAALRKCSIDGLYVPLEIEPARFRKAMEGLKVSGFSGFNVTVPFKEHVIPFLHSVSKEAGLTGAVNTIVIRNGRWYGHNTDGYGFTMLLNRARISPVGKRVLILGAGGAARAVIAAILSEVSSIIICNRSVSRARRLLAQFRPASRKKMKIASWPPSDVCCDIIVNTTSLGLKKRDKVPVKQSLWKTAEAGIDLIYNPSETQFLNSAAKAGVKTAGGLDMLLYQGVRAFELWTGTKAPVTAMRRALLNSLKKQS